MELDMASAEEIKELVAVAVGSNVRDFVVAGISSELVDLNSDTGKLGRLRFVELAEEGEIISFGLCPVVGSGLSWLFVYLSGSVPVGGVEVGEVSLVGELSTGILGSSLDRRVLGVIAQEIYSTSSLEGLSRR